IAGPREGYQRSLEPASERVDRCMGPQVIQVNNVVCSGDRHQVELEVAVEIHGVAGPSYRQSNTLEVAGQVNRICRAPDIPEHRVTEYSSSRDIRVVDRHVIAVAGDGALNGAYRAREHQRLVSRQVIRRASHFE